MKLKALPKVLEVIILFESVGCAVFFATGTDVFSSLHEVKIRNVIEKTANNNLFIISNDFIFSLIDGVN
jgi:hypothetical protein